MEKHLSRENNFEIKREDFRQTMSWRIFRIMAEFVDGFQFIAGFRKAVCIFGSHTTPSSDPDYEKAYQLAKKLAQAGYAIVTGGGPGIMEAANKGAAEAKNWSVGLNVFIPSQGERRNPYLNQSMVFHYFFTRKVMFSFAADSYIFFPGGYGTLDELTEMLCLIQTHKIRRVPIILVGRSFWTPFVNWLNDYILKTNKISAEDLNLFQLVDSPEEAYDLVLKFNHKGRKIFATF